MSCKTPQCKNVSEFVEQSYKDEGRVEPPCTVLDLPNSQDVQVNIHEPGSTIQTLTLESLSLQSAVTSAVQKTISDFLKNPATRRYPCTSDIC
jgi:hypothetical protein